MLRLLSKRAWSRCWSDQQKKDKGCGIRVSIDVCLKRMIYGWNRKTLQHGTRISDLPKPTGTWKVWTSTPSEKQTCYGLQKKNSWQLFDFLVLHTLRETSRYTKYMPFYTVYYVYICIHYIYSIIYILLVIVLKPPLTLQTLEDELPLETSRCQAFNAPLPPGWTEHQVAVWGYPVLKLFKANWKGQLFAVFHSCKGEWGLTEWKYGIWVFWSRKKILQLRNQDFDFLEWVFECVWTVIELFIGSFPSCNMQIRRWN